MNQALSSLLKESHELRLQSLKKENQYLIKVTFITGPLATTVAASDWGLYFEGVFDGCDYNENIEVNHQGILILIQRYKKIKLK